MQTDDLIGLFVQGSLKSGNKFLGTVVSADREYLYLEHKEARKFVLISEIEEMKAEPVKEDSA